MNARPRLKLYVPLCSFVVRLTTKDTKDIQWAQTAAPNNMTDSPIDRVRRFRIFCEFAGDFATLRPRFFGFVVLQRPANFTYRFAKDWLRRFREIVIVQCCIGIVRFRKRFETFEFRSF